MLNSDTQRSALLGLTDSEVLEQRKKFGDNIIRPPAKTPWYTLFLEKFDDPVIRILLVAAVLAIGVGAVHGDYFEGVGIIVAVLLATGIAFVNELKAAKEFDILSQVSDDVPTRVLRNGKYSSVPRKDLVVGDVVVVEAGEEPPVDGEVIECVGLKIDESSLTGESKPRSKRAKGESDDLEQGESTLPYFKAFRGSMVVDGHGVLRATSVGDKTEIGMTAQAASEASTESTPLNQQLESLSKLIGVVGLAVAVATFSALAVRGVVVGELTLSPPQWLVISCVLWGAIVSLAPVWLPMVSDGTELILGWPLPSWVVGEDDAAASESLKRWLLFAAFGIGVAGVVVAVGWFAGLLPPNVSDWLPATVLNAVLSYFMIAVTIIVVAVPEGLAMSVTLSLAYSMRKMTASNTLVRKLHACETVGATTVICSDKTGTLTRNEMQVFSVSVPAFSEGNIDLGTDAGARLVAALAANSTAHLAAPDAAGGGALGNPTEAALLKWLRARDVDYLEARAATTVVDQLAFTTERKWMGTLVRDDSSENHVLHVKGAPEVVLANCTEVLTESGPQGIDSHLERIKHELHDYQKRGMRGIGLAYKMCSSEVTGDIAEHGTKGLTWLGFAAIADPIRDDVPNAIDTCRKAGIRVKMVTGDNAETAQEIAHQTRIWDESCDSSHQVQGSEFHEFSDDEAKAASDRLRVLSRARPMDKVRLVQSLQANGEVVAVTGDGINDCGALNCADVGLAMGITGKAAAKNASDIILLDDSFSTIVNAVMWGRSLYENIQRFIVFQLTINVAALTIAFLGPFVGIELPLTVIQMLWINLIMDTFAALALATEPPHRDVLNRPPRSSTAFIVTRAMAADIFSMASVFLVVLLGLLLWAKVDGTVSEYNLSVFFTVFVMLQFWNLFNVRCFGTNRSAFVGIFQNKSFVFIAAAILLGQIVIVQYGGRFFRTVPLSLSHWLIIGGATFGVLLVGEVKRYILRRKLLVEN